MNSQRPEPGRTRILIVDDDPMVRLLARTAMERLGLDLDEAGNGAEAVSRFQAGAFDLLLLDLEMPVMDGFTTCARIRALPGGSEVGLIVMTGSDDVDSIRRAFQLGATDFITKPINWALLMQRMRFILRARHTLRVLQAERQTLSQAQQIAHLGHWDWAANSNRCEWSEQVFALLGQTPDRCEASYGAFLEAVHPEDRARVNQAIGEALEGGGSYSIEHRILLADGQERQVVSQGRVLDGDGEPVIRSIVQDVTERRLAEERIHQLAFYDTLTGLPNRSLFMDYGHRLLSATQRDGNKAAVLLLDLDRFKRINDSLGHAAGDELLKETARRIANVVRHSDLLAKTRTSDDPTYSLARPGGNEFMLLIRGVTHTDRVANFVQRLLLDLSRPMQVGGQELFVRSSVGIALYPDDGDDLDSLLANAEAALARAKEAGGGVFRFYAREMNQRASERLDLEARLNRAIESDELELYYQPQIRFGDGRLAGFEALLRWLPPGGRPVSPGVFIPIAEETGLILEIGRWVLNRACTQMAAWQAEGYTLVPVAVNLAAAQFSDALLLEDVMQCLSSSGIPPRMLELELTERTIMRDLDETRPKLQALKELGVQLSVDDFGTGYSSMNYLKRFPLDQLKIDRSFIDELETDRNDEAIVRAIVAMSKGLGLATVAEGVETERQREILTEIGCDLLQGFLFSRPVPAPEAAAFMERSTTPGRIDP